MTRICHALQAGAPYQPEARLVIVTLSTFLPVAVTTADGTRAIPHEYLVL